MKPVPKTVRQQRGFTLLELLITMLIVAILSALALPSYAEHIQRTRRGVAQASLLGLASAMERYYVDHHTFAGAEATDIFGVAIAADRVAEHYALSLREADSRHFVLAATPINVQADDSCGVLTLSRGGVRSAEGEGVASQGCWPR